MLDETMQQSLMTRSSMEGPSEEHLQVSRGTHRRQKWPRAICMGLLILCHATFFLPLRALAPVPPDADPWWGMGLILADSAVAWVLIRRVIRKIAGSNTHEP